MPLAVEHRRGREQREQRLPPEAVVRQREQPQQRATQHRVVERAHRRAVVRDARELEVLVQELRVRIVARVEHRHPFERHAVAHRVDHAPHDRAHFVVRVRRRHDRGADCRLLGDRPDLAAQRSHARDDVAIRSRVTREAGNHHARADRTDCAQQPRRRQRQPLRQVRHQHAEVSDATAAAFDQVRCCRHQVVLGVPGRRQPRRHRAVQPHDIARPRALPRQHVERVRSSRSLSSRCTAASASSVAGCSATGANNPGASASAPRTAAATTGVDTGRRPAAASTGAASNSANRYTVRNVTPTTPEPRDVIGPNSPDASSRRVATPTEFVGTTTVTGVSGSSRLGPHQLLVQRLGRGAAVRSRHEGGSHPPIVRFGWDSGVRLVHLAVAALPVLARGA